MFRLVSQTFRRDFLSEWFNYRIYECFNVEDKLNLLKLVDKSTTLQPFYFMDVQMMCMCKPSKLKQRIIDQFSKEQKENSWKYSKDCNFGAANLIRHWKAAEEHS